MNSLKSVWARVAALLMLTICIAVLASCSSSNSSSNESLRIYEMVAGKGSFTAVAGDTTGTRFQLNLSSVPTAVLYFTDRPAQEAGYDTVNNLANYIWPRIYGSVAPNALMRATVAGQGFIDLFCLLEKPTYNIISGQLGFTITYLNGNQKPVSNLQVSDVKIIILNNSPGSIEEWSQLMTGGSSSFSAPASDGSVSITLQQPYGSVFSYTNAPGRKSTVIPLRDFMQSWQARFGAAQPNISIAYDAQNGQAGGVQIVAITRPPTYDAAAGTITFAAKVLYGTSPLGTAGLQVTAPSFFVDGGSPTYSETDLQTLLQTGNCLNCNLEGVDLSKQNLSTANLSGANLKTANLGNTNLNSANLGNADLTGATIDGANMVKATLTGTIGPTGMPGRVINLFNNCSTEIWAAASGNTMAVQCRSNADCNGGTCPPLTGNCITDSTCHNLCTSYPCLQNSDCTEPNTYCGGTPSYNKIVGTGCTSNTDCGTNQFCNTTTGLCGWKNCLYVPIPVENSQIASPAVACSTNSDCANGQFCFTTTSAPGSCATLPAANRGNSWKLGANGATPLFVPTPWAGRFWPRTGCVMVGSACVQLFAGTDAQCDANSVTPGSRTLLQPLTNPQPYPVHCRTDSNCGAAPGNSSIVGGKCNQTDTPMFDAGQQFTANECTIGNDATCDAVKGAGSNYSCIPMTTSIDGHTVNIGICGYRNCTAYQCSGLGQNLCTPATFTCDTGKCFDEQLAPQPSANCRNSGKDSPTLAELNMFLPSKGTDYYDISLVDGANVPVQIAPVSGTYTRGTAVEINPNVSCTSTTDCWSGSANLDYNWVCDTSLGKCVNKFYCGSPGCVSDCSTYGRGLTEASTWGGSNLAIAEKNCPEELKMKAGGTTYVGCLSPTDACSPPHNADPWRTNLSCDTTHMNLYQCTGTNATSCYSAGADSNCCGYPDWMNDFGTAKGLSSNPNWISIALPYYKLFHTASPASYTYPFDDKSGTFTCTGKSDAVNVNYTITFCPK
jgi:hypothetical protein